MFYLRRVTRRVLLRVNTISVMVKSWLNRVNTPIFEKVTKFNIWRVRGLWDKLKMQSLGSEIYRS